MENWEQSLSKFVKVIPKDYKRMMNRIQEQKAAGLTEEEAAMSAFEANVKQEKKAIGKTTRSGSSIRKGRVRWENQQDLWNINREKAKGTKPSKTFK